MNRTRGGGPRKISKHEVQGETTSFEPCYTRLSSDQSNNIVLPSSDVSLYLDKALKALGLVSTLSVRVPLADWTAHRSPNFIHHASPPFMTMYQR
jgi:hypothetical protein